MHEYRWAIAFIAITFLALAIADLHNSDIGTACTNAEGQLVACADLSVPRAAQGTATAAATPGSSWASWFQELATPRAPIQSPHAVNGH